MIVRAIDTLHHNSTVAAPGETFKVSAIEGAELVARGLATLVDEDDADPEEEQGVRMQIPGDDPKEAKPPAILGALKRRPRPIAPVPVDHEGGKAEPAPENKAEKAPENK